MKTRDTKGLSERLDRKVRTVKFLLLGIVLFLIADIAGRLFIPAAAEVPGLFRASIWCMSLAVGFTIFYGFRHFTTTGRRAAFLAVFYIIYLSVLYICGFFRAGHADRIGYQLSGSLLPAIGAVICTVWGELLIRYTRFIKKISGQSSSSNTRLAVFFIIPVFIAFFAIAGGYRLAGLFAGKGESSVRSTNGEYVSYGKDHKEPYRRYDRIFNDINDTQLEAAIEKGVDGGSINNEKEAALRKDLVRITDCRYYSIAELTHSIPYLVPDAAQLLEDIGRAFQDSLSGRGYSRNHDIVVTSVLRTQEQVKKLRRTNTNATENSCHCYGTTFDISYVTFETPAKGKVASETKMREILMQVVYDMRNAERCYVKYEKKQPCLHITVR